MNPEVVQKDKRAGHGELRNSNKNRKSLRAAPKRKGGGRFLIARFAEPRPCW